MTRDTQKVWPVWATFKSLGNKFSHKSRPNIWWFLSFKKNVTFSVKAAVAIFWATLEFFLFQNLVTLLTQMPSPWLLISDTLYSPKIWNAKIFISCPNCKAFCRKKLWVSNFDSRGRYELNGVAPSNFSQDKIPPLPIGLLWWIPKHQAPNYEPKIR